MTAVGIIPYKGSLAGKSRLSRHLTPPQRQQLSRKLLERAIAAIRTVRRIDTFCVVSPETVEQVHLVKDDKAGLNKALRLGIDWAVSMCADVTVIIPADLAFVAGPDIEALLDVLPEKRGGVVAISKDGGTGGLALRPAAIIPPAFGAQSAQRHIQLLRDAGGEPRVLHRHGLEIDVDLPKDLLVLDGELVDVIGSRRQANLD